VTAGRCRFFLVERYAPALDDTCLSVFEAPDAHAVAAVNEYAGVPVDRIVEAEWFFGLST